jgi:quercetin dioxygenase-like cupin family protein
MKISKLSSLGKMKVDMEGAKDVWRQTPISRDDGSPTFSFRVFTIAPKGHTPFHTHPFEHCNYIISGHGLLVQEDGKETAIEKGDFALVLPDEKHQYKNASETDPFVMICAVPKAHE